jgi:hypothetical protein
MDIDEQKKKTKDGTFLSGCKFDGSHVLPAVRLRHAIQNTLRCYGELLDYRYDILLYIRGLLAFILGIVQIF